MSLRLGIDTGGTFTDAVLVDDERHIVASGKCLTTRLDLTHGIGDVISQFDSDYLARVSMVSLSTTLTTNSVVEDLGPPVAVLLPGYDQRQIEQTGLLKILAPQYLVALQGGFDAVGCELQPLDDNEIRNAIQRLRKQVSAFAVSSQFGTRNNSHELRVKALIHELDKDIPVICGHELASTLGAPRRALTAALNARMVAPIHDLIESVQTILKRYGIDAPLMIVKGDGSLASLAQALEKPIGTVLSGPAASVIGACALSGEDTAIIADMGGTTTDVAVVSGGLPRLSVDGARIGNWQPMVEAVQVNSIGLGGDSEVSFGGPDGLIIGPRRVVPTSLLGQLYPEVIPRLQAQLTGMINARSNRFVLRLENNPALLAQLDSVERDAWELLADGPVELDEAVSNDRNLGRALARLKRLGLAIYSGFTPSDAVHVLGMNTHWSSEAAELAARIWMRQMRYLYGFGQWAEGDIESASRMVYQLVHTRIRQLLVTVGMNVAVPNQGGGNLEHLIDAVTRMIMHGGTHDDHKPLFKVDFASDYPLVAVGAPAATYYHEVARSMKMDLRVPSHAEVANAYGAVMGSIIQRAEVMVTQPQQGEFKLFHGGKPLLFDSLEEARQHGEELVRAQATQQICAAGAHGHEITIAYHDIHVPDSGDGELFLESRIVATAIGPACSWKSDTPSRSA